MYVYVLFLLGELGFSRMLLKGGTGTGNRESGARKGERKSGNEKSVVTSTKIQISCGDQ